MEQVLVQEQAKPVTRRKRSSQSVGEALSLFYRRFPLRTFYLLGTRVDNIDGELARKIICHAVEEKESGRATKVFFTNVHSICLAWRNELVKLCINSGDLVLPDGAGLKIGGKVSDHPIRENLNGTDFTPTILRIAEEKGWSVYLLGARPQVVEKCCSALRLSFPRLKVVGSRPGYFNAEEDEAIVGEINTKQPDILLVALGTPLQELWLTRYAYRLRTKVCMAVGGLFDFLSHTRPRAPRWMRTLGLEWLYRFLQDPATKWARVFVEIPMFLFLLFAKRLLPVGVTRFIRRRVIS